MIVPIVGLCLASMSLVLSIWAVTRSMRPSTGLSKEVEGAFRKLEHDVEEMWTKVESHLGRISRLKRGQDPIAALDPTVLKELIEKSRGVKLPAVTTESETEDTGVPSVKDRHDLLALLNSGRS